MRLVLRWQGPVGPGCFPEDEEALARLSGAGVYLRIKRYEGGRIVRYVGQSVRLLARFDQHLRDVLTFSAALRGPDGEVALARDAARRVAAYNALDEILALAAAEAGRMRFYYALAEDGFEPDWLTAIEGALKARMEARLGEPGLAENRQPIPLAGFDDEIAIESDFGALAADAEALLDTVIGTSEIRIPAALMELGHAE